MALLAGLLIIRSSFPVMFRSFVIRVVQHEALAATYLPDHGFSVRPELYLAVVWLTGLVALEDARQKGWPLGRLLLGSFLITYASGLQNFALLGFLGLSVLPGEYFWRNSSWRQFGYRTGNRGVRRLPIWGALFDQLISFRTGR